MTPALTLQTPMSKVFKPRNSQRKKETNALRTTSVSTAAMPAILLANAARALPEEAEEGDNRTDSCDSTNPFEPKLPKSEKEPSENADATDATIVSRIYHDQKNHFKVLDSLPADVAEEF
jgi:hypothetical protein